MRKIALFVATSFISLNALTALAANSSDVTEAIAKSIKKQNENSRQHTEPSMIYGGKDISHPVIATAHESLWSGQPTLVG